MLLTPYRHQSYHTNFFLTFHQTAYMHSRINCFSHKCRHPTMFHIQGLSHFPYIFQVDNQIKWKINKLKQYNEAIFKKHDSLTFRLIFFIRSLAWYHHPALIKFSTFLLGLHMPDRSRSRDGKCGLKNFARKKFLFHHVLRWENKKKATNFGEAKPFQKSVVFYLNMEIFYF